MVVITINNKGKQLEIDIKGSKMSKLEKYFANSIYLNILIKLKKILTK